MAASPLRPNDPTALGPYRLTGRLGRGGMGTVYLGVDAAGHRVAVKVINAELSDDEAFHARFRREVTAARQVRPFCTAAVLDARLDGEPLYVATEYVEGPALDEAVRERGPLRGGDLEALAVNMATALNAIHGAGIVHRDLKPSNVLLSPTGPRVIDFGIARALDAVDGPTRTGQFVGTPAYMAPEIMRGELSPAADVFAWGCVVAYAASGRAPFAGSTVPEIIHRVLNDPPQLDGLSPGLHDLVSRTLAKDPAARPSVESLLQTLTGNSRPVPVTVADPAPTSASAPPGRRPAPRWLSPVAALAAVAVVATIVLTALPDDSEGKPKERTTASGTPEPRRTTYDFTGGPPPIPGNPVFTDDFENPGSGWTKGSTAGQEYYSDGYYLLTNKYGDDLTEDVPGNRSSNLKTQLLNVRVLIGEKAPKAMAGLYCYRYPADSGVLFGLQRDGTATFTAVSGDQRKVLSSKKIPGFDADSRTTLLQAACAWTRTAREPSRLQLGFWIEGKPVGQADLPINGAPNGPSGLFAAPATPSPTAKTEATFNKFSLRSF